MIGNGLINAAADYADKFESLKNEAKEQDKLYLMGQIDYYESTARHMFDSIIGTPIEIRAIRSALEEKIENQE